MYDIITFWVLLNLCGLSTTLAPLQKPLELLWFGQYLLNVSFLFPACYSLCHFCYLAKFQTMDLNFLSQHTHNYLKARDYYLRQKLILRRTAPMCRIINCNRSMTEVKMGFLIWTSLFGNSFSG